MIKTASHFERLDDNQVICRLCPADCQIADGQEGICGSRKNEGGQLVTDNYGEVVTIAVDPIEKKPLYHFYPTSDILSTGPNCCNLKCRHCQNWNISQEKVKTIYVPPEELVNQTKQRDLVGVAFTYTEPVIWYEYIMDTAPLLRQAGLKVVLVSNGYINPEPLKSLLEVVDAFNIDLKGMQQSFYSRVCKGKIEPVLDALRLTAKSDAHLEITNLIIPTHNDSDDDLHQLVDFVASLSDNIPLHFSAYHPSYHMDVAATPVETMIRAYEIGRLSLKHVFLGNIGLDGYSNTTCPGCGALLVRRSGYRTDIVGLNGSVCAKCGADSGIIL
ncbi:MAG: AmmeMemoRadiSam system radical SAM enzyme [candidate division Zixibacteria bacterium]|nr:AmmeMemoRadiSam system radical SAM enzyme [candidate division Zixibacteria bacterium]